MSILDTPRLNFVGQFWCDPCTANNDDVLPDVVNRDTNTLGSSVAGIGTDDQIRDYLKVAELRKDYQASASTPCVTFINSGWNPYGNHWCNFQDTTITSGVSAISGAGPTPVPASDPTLGLSVKLLGSKSKNGIPQGQPVMVDMDPTGLVTTQIWIGGLQIGDPEDGGMVVYFDTRAYQSWLNFMSTVANPGYGGEQNFVGIGCIMQFAIPGYLLPDPTTLKPALAALVAKAKEDLNELVVRFHMMEVEPGYTDVYLQGLFENNQRLANWAWGYLCGTIGVNTFGQSKAEPDGRKLQMYYPRPAMSWASPDGTVRGAIPGADTPWQKDMPPALIGNVAVLVRPDGSLSMDLSCTFPKYGFRNPSGPTQNSPPQGFEKPVVGADVGELELCVQLDAGGVLTVARVPYGVGDMASFRAQGGIVDLTFNPLLYSSILAGSLFIRGSAAGGSNRPNIGVTLLKEADTRVILETRTAYMGPPGSSALVGFYLRYRGQSPPIGSSTTLYIKEYMNIIEVDPTAPCGVTNRPNQSTQIRDPNCLGFPSQITLTNNSGGNSPVYIQANGIAAGVSMLNFQLEDEVRGPSVPAWTTCNYATLRVYPEDDYSAQITAGLTWEFVYEEALRYYYVLFPTMSQYVKLNNRCAVYGARAQIRQMLCMPGLLGDFNRTQNMPVTRTMSPGKVGLVLAWLDQEDADPDSPCKNSTDSVQGRPGSV